ncbi:MAG: hypothetical protein EOO51_03040 [Flavobacterium sp.]|nr:MAG: hypothetical protein EOO51_03040 [Flavobacterium sp.]
MNAKKTTYDNSFVTIKDQELDIHYRQNNFVVDLHSVSKMYLTKKKSRYEAWIPILRRFMDPEYNLCIRTRDNKEIRMDVKASEKQFFIEPIAVVRGMGKSNLFSAS